MLQCLACKTRINSRGSFGHFSKSHPELVEQYKKQFGDDWWEKAKSDYFSNNHAEQPAEEEEDAIMFEGEKWTPERLIYQYGDLGVLILMEKELEKRMSESKLQNRQMIVEAFREFPRYREDRISLKGLLKSLGKAQDPIADLICERVFKIPQKYERTLRFANQTPGGPIVPIPAQSTPPPPELPVPGSGPGTEEPAEKPLTKKELLEILDEREREREKREYRKKIERENKKLKERIKRLERKKHKTSKA